MAFLRMRKTGPLAESHANREKKFFFWTPGLLFGHGPLFEHGPLYFHRHIAGNGGFLTCHNIEVL